MKDEEKIIAELERVGYKIIGEINYRSNFSSDIDIVTGLRIAKKIIDKHISELKGENK